jgi:hypothetical protein
VMGEVNRGRIYGHTAILRAEHLHTTPAHTRRF